MELSKTPKKKKGKYNWWFLSISAEEHTTNFILEKAKTKDISIISDKEIRKLIQNNLH